MRPRDVFETINEQDEATVQRLVDRLEYRAHDPTFSRFRDTYLDRMGIAADASVLDLGCGTGVLTRALAQRDGFTGPIAGVDHSPALIDAARRLARDEGVGDRITFHVGDAHRLAFADGAFDAVIAQTLLSHVGDPLAVLREATRVVRPGGIVAIFDADFASWSFGCSDEALEKAMEKRLVATMVAQPRVMREMPRLLPQAGLTLTGTLAFAYADIGTGGFFLNAAEFFGPLVARAGFVPGDRVETWLAEQRNTSADGTFFAAGNYYAYLATPRTGTGPGAG